MLICWWVAWERRRMGKRCTSRSGHNLNDDIPTAHLVGERELRRRLRFDGLQVCIEVWRHRDGSRKQNNIRIPQVE
jgi:hypothetical protein